MLSERRTAFTHGSARTSERDTKKTVAIVTAAPARTTTRTIGATWALLGEERDGMER